MPADFNPALQLLIAAVDLTPRRGDRIRSVRMTAADWTTLVADARRHGLVSLLAVVAAERTDVPEDVLTSIGPARRAHAVAGLRGASELIRVLEALRTSGVGAVALKGPAFAQWLYGDVGFRRFSDLDVLVSPGDLDRALRVLDALGYRLARGMSGRTARAIYRALGALPLESGSGPPIDLHWRLAHARFGAALTPRDILAESIPIVIAGSIVRIPSPTHAALFALLHAAKHVWCTLELFYAIARLLQRDDVDWRRVRTLAKDTRAWQGCATGVTLASELSGVGVPGFLLEEPWPAACARLREHALTALVLPEGVFPDRWTERQVHHAAFDRWRDRVRYDVSRVIAPTPLEWQWCPLPDALTALYGPLRIVRLGVAAVNGGVRSLTRGFQGHS
jgi:hypothetical protein